MKFEVKALAFLKSIIPVTDVATKAVFKDLASVGKISIKTIVDQVEAVAFGGRLGIKADVSNKTVNDLSLKILEEGEVIVSAVDLSNVLSSFMPQDLITFELSKKGKQSEVSIYASNDNEEFQTLPCYDVQIDLPKASKKVNQQVKIDKKAFLKGLNKVFFAIGYEETKPQYLYWAMKVSKEKVRFSAGDGGRWAVLDMTGKDFIDYTDSKEIEFLFMKEHTQVFSKVLDASNVDDLTIKQYAKTSGSFSVFLEASPYEIILVGMDPSMVGVDESVFLDRDYKHRILVNIADLEYASRGIYATFNEQCRKLNKEHKVKVSFDFKKKKAVLKANYSMSSSRKVTLVDCDSADNDCWFIAVSPYLREITGHAQNSETIQMETSGPKTPVLVRFFAGNKVTDKDTIKFKDDALDISEQFSTFFATYDS